MDRGKIDQCVELLCHRGCREVGQIITRLDAGEAVDGTESLADAEREAVLQELRSIMAVYGGQCHV